MSDLSPWSAAETAVQVPSPYEHWSGQIAKADKSHFKIVNIFGETAFVNPALYTAIQTPIRATEAEARERVALKNQFNTIAQAFMSIARDADEKTEMLFNFHDAAVALGVVKDEDDTAVLLADNGSEGTIKTPRGLLKGLGLTGYVAQTAVVHNRNLFMTTQDTADGPLLSLIGQKMEWGQSVHQSMIGLLHREFGLNISNMALRHFGPFETVQQDEAGNSFRRIHTLATAEIDADGNYVRQVHIPAQLNVPDDAGLHMPADGRYAKIDTANMAAHLYYPYLFSLQPLNEGVSAPRMTPEMPAALSRCDLYTPFEALVETVKMLEQRVKDLTAKANSSDAPHRNEDKRPYPVYLRLAA